MTIQRYFVILITILFITGCVKEKGKDIHSLCPDFTVLYFNGSGWTGSELRITILYPDTISIYEKKSIPVSFMRQAKYQISKIEIDSLFQDILALSKFNLGNRYGFKPGKAYDAPGSFIKYRVCNCSDSTDLAPPVEDDAPREIFTLISRVYRIALNHDSIIGHLAK